MCMDFAMKGEIVIQVHCPMILYLSMFLGQGILFRYWFNQAQLDHSVVVSILFGVEPTSHQSIGVWHQLYYEMWIQLIDVLTHSRRSLSTNVGIHLRLCSRCQACIEKHHNTVSGVEISSPIKKIRVWWYPPLLSILIMFEHLSLEPCCLQMSHMLLFNAFSEISGTFVAWWDVWPIICFIVVGFSMCMVLDHLIQEELNLS